MTRRREMIIGASAILVLAAMVLVGGLREQANPAVDWRLAPQAVIL